MAYRTKSDIGGISLVSFDKNARRRAMRVDLSGGIDDTRFGRGGAVAGVDDDRLAADFADFAPQWPDVVDLEFERGEGASGRLAAVDRAAQRRIEERRRPPAGCDAHAVVELFVRGADEHDAAGGDFGETQAEQRHHRRRTNRARHHLLKKSETADLTEGRQR